MRYQRWINHDSAIATPLPNDCAMGRRFYVNERAFIKHLSLFFRKDAFILNPFHDIRVRSHLRVAELLTVSGKTVLFPSPEVWISAGHSAVRGHWAVSHTKRLFDLST